MASGVEDCETLLISRHPLIKSRLRDLRDARTCVANFRRIVHELGMLLAYEVFATLATEWVEIETPVERTRCEQLQAPLPALIAVLRAGQPLLDGLLAMLPAAPVGHIGCQRDPRTLEPVEYYEKLPSLTGRDAIVVDPMLATGNSSAAAINRVLRAGPRSVRLVCLLAAPEGIALLHQRFPQLVIHAAAVDRQLDGRGYILPGLGDAGDRIYGTEHGSPSAAAPRSTHEG
jgi:uracil phosphoribosyltransferase